MDVFHDFFFLCLITLQLINVKLIQVYQDDWLDDLLPFFTFFFFVRQKNNTVAGPMDINEMQGIWLSQ
jgi:hypothetical protein